jgi:hypothetical protein
MGLRSLTKNHSKTTTKNIMKLKLLIITACIASISCTNLTKPDGTKLVNFGANVTMADGTVINNDTAWKTGGSVAKFGIVGGVIKDVTRTAGGVFKSKDGEKTIRSADGNVTKVKLDDNATVLEQARIQADLEKFKTPLETPLTE